jgi:ABC-2 type transport system ATP-binding protein
MILQTATLQHPASPRAAEREVVVRIRDLCKRFPVRRRWRETVLHPWRVEYAEVLRDVSFEVHRREVFGLLGPNGAGKTTLFKVLSTLVLPDAGTASVAGLDVVRDARRVTRILTPVIADERSLNWRVSARENLRFYASLNGLRGKALLERVDELLGVVELADAGEKMVGKFSSGMKQRLLIARALLCMPQVLLLDEPTRSLDPLSARRFRKFLREEVVERRGCTVLLATHSPEEALEFCDRVAVLDRGTLLTTGSADRLMQYVGESRYRIWTRTPRHSAFTVLQRLGTIQWMHEGSVDEEGWTPVDVEIAGGPDSAAEANAYLAKQDVPVARLERLRPSLADLIERIVALRVEERP